MDGKPFEDSDAVDIVNTLNNNISEYVENSEGRTYKIVTWSPVEDGSKIGVNIVMQNPAREFYSFSREFYSFFRKTVRKVVGLLFPDKSLSIEIIKEF